MAEPRAGEAVADCSEADAGGKFEVLSTGKRPAIVAVEAEIWTLRAIVLSLLTSERAAKILLQLAIARSFLMSLVALSVRVLPGAVAMWSEAEDLIRPRICCKPTLVSTLDLYDENSGWRGLLLLAL